MTFAFPFDFPMLEYIQSNMRNSFFDFFFPTITHLGDAGIFWILLTLGLLIYPKTRKIGLCSAIALVLDVLLCNCGLKLIIARTRPYAMDEFKTYGLELLTSIQSDTSFPSGHTAASFASAMALYTEKSRLRIPAMILAVIIAFSRLYVAVHFPSDIIGGIILGIACGIAAHFICKKLWPVIIKKFDEKNTHKNQQA